MAQLAIFALLYSSYVTFYFNRKNYSTWFSHLVNTLKVPSTNAALFGSTMELTYGLGKLVAGPLVDSLSPKLTLAFCLFLSSLCNLLMFSNFEIQSNGQVVGLNMALVLWGLNGVIQAQAWPAIGSIFMNWFASSPNKGLLYSLLSTSQNVGAGLIPIILTAAISFDFEGGFLRGGNFEVFGLNGLVMRLMSEEDKWKLATIVPAVLGLVCSLLLALFLKDKPESKAVAGKQPHELIVKNSKDGVVESLRKWPSAAAKLLTNRLIVLLSIGYCFLATVRIGFSDWSFVFLRDLGLSTSKEESKSVLAYLELGGFIGGILSGYISDKIFGGRRAPVMFIFCAFNCLVLGSIFFASPQILKHGVREMISLGSAASLSIDVPLLMVFYFLFGVCTFGPHMLVGLMTREVYPAAPSTSSTFASFIAQFGGILAGYPVSLLLKAISTNVAAIRFLSGLFGLEEQNPAKAGWKIVALLWILSSALAAISFYAVHRNYEYSKPKKE